jgi:aminopeptidase N
VLLQCLLPILLWLLLFFSATRWEAGQRLYMKLLLQLYHAAAAGPSSMTVRERCAEVGGVPASLVAAFKAVLEDPLLDGSFKVG